MTRLTFVTKTYRPDFEAFVTLHQSVLKHSAPDVEHHAIVPKEDLELFASIGSPRLKVQETGEFLPASFRSVAPAVALVQRIGKDGQHRKSGEMFINLRRPWHPVRGWILQQIVKLSAVAASDADVVVTLDSDVALVRPVTADTFLRNGVVRFYRKPGAVHAGMPRHITWHKRANALIGRPERPIGPAPDYISSLLAWDPSIVRRLLRHVSEVAGTDWTTVIAAEWQFSECFLYGAFVDSLGTARDRAYISETSLCHAYWDPKPMDEHEMERFVGGLGPDDIALHIQSTSGTSKELRVRALSAAEQRCLGAELA